MQALKITTTGDITTVNISEDNVLKDLYREIGCSMVEVVRISEGVDLWCDEEGRLINKDVNLSATDVAVQKLDESGRGLLGSIVGDVIIMGINEETGESIGLSDHQVAEFKNLA